MKRTQMSREYRRSKRTLSLALDQRLSQKGRPCNSNTEILCAWNASRKGLTKHKSTSVVASPKSETPSLLPEYPLDDRNDVPCDWKTDERTAFVKRWLPRIVKLLPNFEFQFSVKGLADRLMLFREKRTKAYLLVRLLTITDSKVAQEKAFAAQRVFESKLGIMVPRVHFWYKLNDGKEIVRIFGMDPVQGSIDQLLFDPVARKKISKSRLARSIKEILLKLKKAKLQHGDFQFGNMSYRLNTSGDIDRVGLIDFEFSSILEDEQADKEGILKDAWSFGLLKFLVKAGIHVPQWMQTAVDNGLDPREENPKHQDGIGYVSTFEPLQLKTLSVE